MGIGPKGKKARRNERKKLHFQRIHPNSSRTAWAKQKINARKTGTTNK